MVMSAEERTTQDELEINWYEGWEYDETLN